METEKTTQEKQSVFKEESSDIAEKEQVSSEKTTTGLEQNTAGLLCYLAGFVTGIIFIILEKENRFVRFHAMQSIFISAALFALNIVLSFLPIIGWAISLLVSPIAFILWIVLMVKAYQGKWFKLPIVGRMAEKQLNNLKD